MHVSKQRKEKKVVKVNIELQEDFTRSLNLNWDFISISTITAAKSLQSCPTLYDPTDGSPPSSPLPWDSPGKNTGMGCHFLLQCMKVKSESEVSLSCETLRSHGLQPTRLLHPWDSPGKNGVGCHCLLHPYTLWVIKFGLTWEHQHLRHELNKQ